MFPYQLGARVSQRSQLVRQVVLAVHVVVVHFCYDVSIGSRNTAVKTRTQRLAGIHANDLKIVDSRIFCASGNVGWDGEPVRDQYKLLVHRDLL
ncbi:hypothetical protein JCM18882A_32810 [Brevibacterium metallidurans]|uniref:PLD phosphodiesterase domain-containing protein n=1 Tax=Brevibacterium metallidurans TaxID=1482676 RepID=A0ABN0SSC4_9MICO